MSVMVITLVARDGVASGQFDNAHFISPFPHGGRRKADSVGMPGNGDVNFPKKGQAA
jgi:hypothetical protein